MSRPLLVTCEHGGNRVPARHRARFAGAERVLASHRGWDPGALELARLAARTLHAPLLAVTTTRLLVDTNRSEGHPRLFSAWSRGLSPAEREDVLARFWRPHREETRQRVEAHRGRAPFLHVSFHSFTPRWRGKARPVDVGFLCDPARDGERALVERWRARLRARDGSLRLRRNQPYRGTSDGLTTSLRRSFGEERYLGLELEVSQRFPLGAPARWSALRRDLVGALREALAE